MAAALPLDEDRYVLQDPFAPPRSGIPVEETSTVGDYARALASGAYDLAGQGAGVIQYFRGTGADPNTREAAIRQWAEEGSEHHRKGMSERARRALDANILPSDEDPDIWDEDVSIAHSLGLKTASSIPSIIASLIPGSLAGRVALAAGAAARTAGKVATTAGGLAAGAQTTGDLFNDTMDEIVRMSDEDLQKENGVYRGLREMGLEEMDAKQRVIDYAAGWKPLYMGALTALTSKIGVEGLVSKGIAGEARKGLVRGAAAGALGEATQEAVEGSAQEIMTQWGAADAREMDPNLDWYKALEAAAQGVFVGGGIGAGVGAVTNVGRDREQAPAPAAADADPAVVAAATAATNPVTPEVTTDLEAEVEGIQANLPSPGELEVPRGTATPAQPGATAPAVPVPGPEPVTVPSPIPGIGPDEAMALAPDLNEEGWEPAGEEDYVAPGAISNLPVGSPVVGPRVAALIGSAGYGQPLPETPATTLPATPETPPVPAAVAPEPIPPEVATEAGVQPTAEVPVPREVASEGAGPLAGLPPVPPGHVRMYHGGEDPTSGGGRWVSPDYEYAKNYRPGAPVHYVDIPEGHPGLKKSFEDEGTGMTAPYVSFEAPEDIAAQMKPVGKRVLRDLAQQAEEEKQAKKSRTGPRVSKKMKEQIAAGKEALPAREAKKRDFREKINAVAATIKNYMAANTYDPAAMTDPAAMLSYIKGLAKAGGPRVSLNNLPEDAPNELKLLAAARKITDKSTETELRDFMVNDIDLRRGGTLIKEFRKAQAASHGAGTGAAEAAGEAKAEGEGIFEQGRAEEEKPPTPEELKGMRRILKERRMDTSSRTRRGVAKLGRKMAKKPAEEAAPAAPVKQVAVEVRKRRALKKPDELQEKAIKAGIVTREEVEKGAAEAERKVEAMERFVEAAEGSARRPIVITSAADIKKASERIEQPKSPAQAQAENYPQGNLVWGRAGLKIGLETKKGGIREDKKNVPPRWKVKLKSAYGRIKGTKGADGGEIDIYLGEHPESDRVWIVDQKDLETGKFDEHKVLGGFRTPEEALEAYRGGFSDGRADERIMGITEMTRQQLGSWVKEEQTKPVTTKASRIKLKADVKKALEAKTPQTEEQAAEELKDNILRDNQDVLEAPARRIQFPLTEVGYPGQSKETADWLRERNRVRAWVNSLSDEEYGRLTPSTVRKLQDASSIRTVQMIEGDLKAMLAAKQDPLAMLSDEEILAETGDENLAYEMHLARERAREGPRAVRKTTLRRLLKETPLPSGINDVNRTMMAQIRDRISKLAADVPVYVVDRATMLEYALSDMHRRGDYRLPSGYYDPNTDSIILLDEKFSHRLLLHEGAHAVYENALNARKDVQDHIQALIDATRRQFLKEADEQGITSIELPYGLTNPSEFLVEAFANPEFQDLLTRTPVPADKRVPYRIPGLSAFTSFLRQLGEIIWGGRKGFRPDTALEQIGKVAAHLDEQVGRERSGQPLLPSLSAGPVVNVKEELAAYVKDVPIADDYNLRRIGLHAATFHSIQRAFDSLFRGNPIARIAKAVDLMRKTAGDIADEGRTHAEDWLKLQYKDYGEARAAAQLAIDMTTANMNPVDKTNFTEEDLLKANPHLANKRYSSYQARQRLVRLNAQFMALKPETRALVTRSGNWFRDTQNRMTKLQVGKLLAALNPTLTPQMYADLTNKITKGKLTEEDRPTIDNDIVFKAMQGASELRLIDGIYFPLMRYGEYIVSTRSKVQDMHGGQWVQGEEDVIEWRAADEKAAQKLYEKFAKDPNAPTAISTGLVRYDKKTGKRISKVDAQGVPHDVAFRARVQRKGVHFFETQRAAKRFMRENRDDPAFEYVDQKFFHRSEALKSGELSTQQMRALLKTVEDKKDINETTRQLLSNILTEASVRQLSGNRIEHRSLPRRGVKGASEDIPRAMVMYGQAAGNTYARMKHMDDIRAPLNEMHELNKNERTSKDYQARLQVIDEVEKRVLTSSTDSFETPRLVQDYLTLSYLRALFSPSYAAINGMQPWMVTAPVLGGEYGNLRAGHEIGRAYNAVGGLGMLGSGFANTGRGIKGIFRPGNVTIDTTNVVQSMRDNVKAQPDGQRLLEVLDEAISRGKIEESAGQEVAAAAGVGANKARRAIARVDRAARQLPQMVEALNRGVTLVAAYRLHFAATQDHKASLNYAFDKLMMTQGDYSVQNNPRFFNHWLLRPALQFKKYAIMMVNLLVDIFRRAFGRNVPRKDRMAAAKTLANIIGVQMLMAGSLGLPGVELLKAGFMIAGVMGFGDGWEEQERNLRGLLDRNFGKDWGEMLTTGVVGKLIDIDLSKRLSLADLAVYGEPENYNEEGVKAYLFQMAMGAPGSMAMDFFKGLGHASEGDFLKAIQAMVPIKLVSDIAKAVRGYSNRDMDLDDAVKQVAGFRTRRLAQEAEETGAKVAEARERREDATDLKKAYINAETKAELMKVRAKIIAHNNMVDTEAKKMGLKKGPLTQKVFTGALDKVRAEKERKRRALRGEAYAQSP